MSITFDAIIIKISRNFLIFFCFVFIPSSAFGLGEFCDSKEEGVLVRRIYDKTLSAYIKYGNIFCVGTGCATNLEIKYTCLKLHMELRKSLSENEARQMIVEAAKIFLANINEDKQFIEKYAEKPFTIQNLDIIFFLSPNSETSLYEPDLLLVSIYNGSISYFTKRCGEIYGYKDVFEETYEEAVQKLKEAKAGEPTREELTKKALSR